MISVGRAFLSMDSLVNAVIKRILSDKEYGACRARKAEKLKFGQIMSSEHAMVELLVIVNRFDRAICTARALDFMMIKGFETDNVPLEALKIIVREPRYYIRGRIISKNNLEVAMRRRIIFRKSYRASQTCFLSRSSR